jgi:hypothetical protein
VEGLILHEDHVSNLKAPHEVLDGGSEVTTTGPHVLDKGDFIGLYSQLLSKPSVVELYALVLEEDILVRIVEDLDTHHNESGVMSAGQTNIVKIIESNAELGADEGIGGRVKLSSHAVGLEAIDTSGHIVHVVSPSGDDGVALDGLAWDAS